MVDKKLGLDGYERNYSHNLGLSEQTIKELKRSIDTNLVLMVRKDEKFDLDEVLVFLVSFLKRTKVDYMGTENCPLFPL